MVVLQRTTDFPPKMCLNITCEFFLMWQSHRNQAKVLNYPKKKKAMIKFLNLVIALSIAS